MPYHSKVMLIGKSCIEINFKTKSLHRENVFKVEFLHGFTTFENNCLNFNYVL